MNFQDQLKAISQLDISGYGKDFLLTWDKSDDEIKATLFLAELFKEMHKQGLTYKTFDAGLAFYFP